MEVAMAKKECKLKMKLDQIIENKQENVTAFTHIFKPTLPDLEKHVSLKITSSDPYATLGDIGLPSGIGDTVIVLFSTKEEQTKLAKE
jgi:hypothetical protein